MCLLCLTTDLDGQIAALRKLDIAVGRVSCIEIDTGNYRLRRQALARDQDIASAEDRPTYIHPAACNRRIGGTVERDIAVGGYVANIYLCAISLEKVSSPSK